MVGDIFGKSWNSKPSGQSQSQSLGIGVVGTNNKNPNLFGDLVSNALGQGKSSTNAPLKSSKGSSFSMGGVKDSLPKMGSANLGNNGGGGGGNLGFGSNSGGSMRGIGGNGGGNLVNNGGVNSGYSQSYGGFGSSHVNKGSNSGVSGGSMRGIGGGGGVGMRSNNDPFGNLVDFSSKPMNGGGGGDNGGGGNGGSGNVNLASKGSGSLFSEDFGFGDFQNASKSSTTTFGDFQNASKSNTMTFSSGNSNVWGSSSVSGPKTDGFSTQNAATSVQSSGADSFDMFFSSSSVSTGGNGGGATVDSVGGGDDWGFGGDHDDGGNTTEIEGLPPPPAGVSASSAKSKGLDNYKQGQFADAIKWLSWAVVLLEKTGDKAGSTEVLTCRASCYKEVGEYKKAVADCTKILDNDKANVGVLVQRALLYESMEKYRLGADDLRTVMKLDPGNRVARSTIHRLNKMAD